MKKAVAYLRVSTESQLDKFGLLAQEEAIRTFAEQNNIEIVKSFKEEAVSGSTEVDGRIALVECLDFMAENEGVETCVIYELGRLARDLMIQETIILQFRENGYELLSCLEPDLMENDPMRKAFRQFRGIMNEFERAMITMRLKGGIVQKAKQGGHATGRVPLGYKSVLVDGKKTLEKVDDEVEIVKLVFKLRDDSLSIQKIVDYLNGRGYKPKNWTEEKPTKFHKSTVHKILNNQKYIGTVTLHQNGKLVSTAQNDALRVL